MTTGSEAQASFKEAQAVIAGHCLAILFLRLGALPIGHAMLAPGSATAAAAALP